MVGFSSPNKDALFARYICPACALLLRDPVQLNCGHRYCQSCIVDEEKISIKCIKCEKLTLRSEIFYDRGIKNDMELLNIICNSCQWIGLFKNYQDHLINNHSNSVTNMNNRNPVLFQMRRLVRALNDYSNNLQILKGNIQEIRYKTSTYYKSSIEETNLSQEILPTIENYIVSYDGILLLKVNIQSASNKKSFVTSPPFYTSSNGYKMCVRFYLNGNGSGQSTHISIFLILMRGEYDVLLKWPCNLQIIFCLYDLINQKDHIIESFQSDKNSIYFERPKSEMNIATGFPKFVSLSKIQQENSPYVYNGSIYIKIMGRENFIPSSILSNVMCIDPALPVYMQEELIQKEIEKNQMQKFKLSCTLKYSK